MMRVTVDGRLIELPAGATASDAKKAAGLSDSDSLVEVAGARAEVKSESSQLSPESKYRSIPPIEQG